MYKAPRGTSDILSEEQPYFEFIKHKAAEISRLRGYQRIDTPVFEDSGLFVRGVGQGTDIVEKEMYTFQDRGGDNMTLRPEGTAPVCRAYIEHGMNNLPQPVNLYYIAPLFRYERHQAGRFRQHNQFG
ncbi:MAG: ATP phosphoribosyltransferase regulatory subunit [Chloroflexi bacterium]|nr:ATP phosphoribosyltransferase regulatory subunit [Chloroflexota bacterium]